VYANDLATTGVEFELASGTDAARYVCFPADRRVSRCMEEGDRQRQDMAGCSRRIKAGESNDEQRTAAETSIFGKIRRENNRCISFWKWPPPDRDTIDASVLLPRIEIDHRALNTPWSLE
jgi:hypothetical protein